MAARTNAAVEFVDRHLKEGRAEKVAFRDPRRSLTYGALADRAARVGPALEGLGVTREQRVVMLMLDTVDFPVFFWGAIRSGVIPVPLNTLLGPDQYAYVLEDSRAPLVIASAPLVATAEAAVAASGRRVKIVTAGAESGGAHPRLEDLLDEAAPAPEAADTLADEVAFWLYSSGSTGMPKGVKHVHSSLMETARLYGEGVLGLAEDDVVYSAAKLFFAYGLGNAMTFPMAVGACAALLDERPTPKSVFAVLRREQPTIFFGVPTLYAAMLADPECTPENGSRRLRLCVSAGEALPEHVGLAWKKKFGVDILDGTGSTEMLHIYLTNAPGDLRYGTSGRAVPGYELRLVDEEGREVGVGEIGEMLVRGPSHAEGYWNQREKSRRTFEGAWTRTGDKYVREADGRFVCCGRTDDMFKVSGIWVSPFEVEAALISHDAVLEAAVVPAKDADGLEKPKAYIVLKDAARSADGLGEELKEHVKSAIGPWKYPRWIEVVESLPKTATGKIQRFKLRAGA
ncbi:MAG TPA: benzoate-CoA ligase family protein [Beijerinckiaceae bacterium]